MNKINKTIEDVEHKLEAAELLKELTVELYIKDIMDLETMIRVRDYCHSNVDEINKKLNMLRYIANVTKITDENAAKVKKIIYK